MGEDAARGSLTCLHHVVHGGEALADGGADRAQDEQRGQVDVAHQGPAQQAAVLVPTVDAAGQRNLLKGSARSPRRRGCEHRSAGRYLEMRNMRRSGQGRLTNWFHQRFTTRVT